MVLAVVGFGVFVAADDLTVVTTMLRPIIGDLGIVLPDGLDDAAWIVNAYLVAYVAVMPFMGRLSDLLGRRRVYIGALTLFLIGSIVIPLSSSLGPFLVGRVMTALGGGALVPIGMAVVADAFAQDRRARALGTLGAVDTLGWVWGPLFGAFLVRFLSWEWQFYLNIPLAILGIAAAWWALADLQPAREPGRIDWLGAALLTGALVSLNLALLGSAEVQSVSGLDELTGSTGAGLRWLYLPAAALGVAFAWWQRRASDPLIDTALFRGRNLSVAVTINFFVGGRSGDCHGGRADLRQRHRGRRRARSRYCRLGAQRAHGLDGRGVIRRGPVHGAHLVSDARADGAVGRCRRVPASRQLLVGLDGLPHHGLAACDSRRRVRIGDRADERSGRRRSAPRSAWHRGQHCDGVQADGSQCRPERTDGLGPAPFQPASGGRGASTIGRPRLCRCPHGRAGRAHDLGAGRDFRRRRSGDDDRRRRGTDDAPRVGPERQRNRSSDHSSRQRPRNRRAKGRLDEQFPAAKCRICLRCDGDRPLGPAPRRAQRVRARPPRSRRRSSLSAPTSRLRAPRPRPSPGR